MDDLKTKAIQGWAYLSASRLFQAFIGLAVVAASLRYFGPELIGVYAVSNSLLNLLLAVNLGTGPAVQTFLPEFEERGWGWSIRKTVQISFLLRSVFFLIVSVLLYLGAGPIAEYFEMPLLAILVRLLAARNLVSILVGPFDVHTMLGLRLYRGVVAYNVLFSLGNAGALAIAILTGGTLADYVTYLVLAGLPAASVSWAYFLRTRGAFSRPRVEGEPSRAALAAKLVRFCIPTSLNQVLAQIHFHLANLIAGKFLGAAPTGYLSFATGLVSRIDDLLKPFAIVMLPVFSKLKLRGRDQLAAAFTKTQDYAVYGAFFITAVLVGFAREITLVIGGAQFLPAVPILQIVSGQLLFRFPIHPVAQLNYSLNLPYINLLYHAIKIAFELLLYVLLTSRYGIHGLAVAILSSWGLASLLLGFHAHRLLFAPGHVLRFLREVLRYVCYSAVVFLLYLVGESGFFGPISVLTLRATVLFAIGLFVARHLKLLKWDRLAELRVALRSG